MGGINSRRKSGLWKTSKIARFPQAASKGASWKSADTPLPGIPLPDLLGLPRELPAAECALCVNEYSDVVKA